MVTVLQKRILGFSLIFAPVLMLVHDGIGLLHADDLFWPASVAFWFSFLGYVGLAAGLVRLAGETALAIWGAVLTVAGALVGVTLVGISRMEWSMGVHGIEQARVREIVFEPVVFATSRAPGLMFPLGLLMLALALRSSGVLGRAATVVLIVGIVLFPVGRITGELAFNVAGDALMALVYGRLGLRTLSGAGRTAGANGRAG